MADNSFSPYFANFNAAWQPAQQAIQSGNLLGGIGDIANALIGTFDGRAFLPQQSQQTSAQAQPVVAPQVQPATQAQPQSQPLQRPYQSPMNSQGSIPSGPWGLMTTLWDALPQTNNNAGFAGLASLTSSQSSSGNFGGWGSSNGFGVY